MALDSFGTSADSVLTNEGSPGTNCQEDAGAADANHQQEHAMGNDLRSPGTAEAIDAFVPTLLQQLEAACNGGPLHNPATDAWVSERRAAYDAEQTRDLAGLDRQQLAASVRALFFHQAGEQVGTDFGVDLLVDGDEIVDAAVSSVATFAELWGAPVTHERAEAVANEVRQRDRRDEHRDSLESAVERAATLAAARAEETYRLGNN